MDMIERINLQLNQMNHIKVLSYIKDLEPGEVAQIGISHDCKHILYTDPNEKFIFEDNGSHQIQRKLTWLDNYHVLYFEEDKFNSGFHVGCCRTYDKKLRIRHTNDKDFGIVINRCVEIKNFTFFDLAVKSSKGKKEGTVET